MQEPVEIILTSRSKRHAKRRVVRVGAGIAAGVVVIAALGIGAFFLYRASGEGLQKKAVQEASYGDAVIEGIDDIVTANVDARTPSDIESLQKRIDPARRHLQEATRLLDRAAGKEAGKDKEQIEAMRLSVSAREDILKLAPELLNENLVAAQTLIQAGKGWEQLNEGLSCNASSVAQLSVRDETHVMLARELAKQAATAFEKAGTSFNQAQTIMPEADMTAYVHYASERKDLAEQLVTVDNAFLKKQTPAARAGLAAYNEGDRALAKLSKKTMRPLGTIIAEAYKARSGLLTQQYFSARERVAIMDKQVR